MEKNCGVDGEKTFIQDDCQAESCDYFPRFEPPLVYVQQVPALIINPSPYFYSGSEFNQLAGVPYSGQFSQPVAPVFVQPQRQIINTIFGRYPIIYYCSICNVNTCTRVEFKTGCFVWVMFFILLFIFPLLSCLPFCVQAWQDAYHFCPTCGSQLGKCFPI